MSRDATTAPPASTTSPKAAKSKRKINLAPNFPNVGRDLSSDTQAFSPISPSQDKLGTVRTQGEERKYLVTGCDSSSGSGIGPGRDASELVVITSQVDNCHITSGNSGHPDSPLLDTTSSSYDRRRQNTKLIATISETPDNKSGSLPTKPLKSGVGLSGWRTDSTTKSSLYHTEEKYTAASKSSSRQYGALRGSDVKPVDSSHCVSRVSSQVKGSVRIVSGRHIPDVHNGLSGQCKTLHNGRSYPPHYSSSNTKGPMHSGTGTRKPPSSNSHSASGGSRSLAQGRGVELDSRISPRTMCTEIAVELVAIPLLQK